MSCQETPLLGHNPGEENLAACILDSLNAKLANLGGTSYAPGSAEHIQIPFSWLKSPSFIEPKMESHFIKAKVGGITSCLNGLIAPYTEDTQSYIFKPWAFSS